MARRKRVPHKPDAFQSHGGRAAVAIAERGKIIAVCFALAGVVFIIAFAILHSRARAEENAWAAFYHARGNSAKLRRALEAYGSSPARPHMLMTIARADMTPSAEENVDRADEPDEESPEKRGARLRRAAVARKARLQRAERALRELTDDYPDHFYNVLGLNLLGLVLEEQGRYDKDKYHEAAAVLERALDKAPKTLRPKIRYDIGRNYMLAGKPKAARFHLGGPGGAKAATRTVTVRRYRWFQEVPADWIDNAKYLDAQIGPGERAIPVPEKTTPAPRAAPKRPAPPGAVLRPPPGPGKAGRPPRPKRRGGVDRRSIDRGPGGERKKAGSAGKAEPAGSRGAGSGGVKGVNEKK